MPGARENESVLSRITMPGTLSSGAKLKCSSRDEDEEKADKASPRKDTPRRSSPLIAKNPEDDFKIKPATPRSAEDAERVAKQREARQQVKERQDAEKKARGGEPSQNTPKQVSSQKLPSSQESPEASNSEAAVDEAPQAASKHSHRRHHRSVKAPPASGTPPNDFFGTLSGVEGEALHAGRLRLTQVAPGGPYGPEQMARQLWLKLRPGFCAVGSQRAEAAPPTHPRAPSRRSRLEAWRGLARSRQAAAKSEPLPTTLASSRRAASTRTVCSSQACSYCAWSWATVPSTRTQGRRVRPGCSALWAGASGPLRAATSLRLSCAQPMALAGWRSRLATTQGSMARTSSTWRRTRGSSSQPRSSGAAGRPTLSLS